ncbi:hypothetical protein bpmyx0001_31290 [Bacillus pseudomycoides DSM 12442]|nr:hypothetical protein bpmyx0001_31290 [Bacillus pseudomycoides DSM 12442]
MLLDFCCKKKPIYGEIEGNLLEMVGIVEEITPFCHFI